MIASPVTPDALGEIYEQAYDGATFVRLTPKGLRHFARMAEAHEGWVNDILARFSREQSHALIGSLDTLAAATRSGAQRP
mgnify:CR=1 FL=1